MRIRLLLSVVVSIEYFNITISDISVVFAVVSWHTHISLQKQGDVAYHIYQKMNRKKEFMEYYRQRCQTVRDRWLD